MKKLLLLVAALLACSFLIPSGIAQARPRDEVMSGAFRCAAISESRLWLDCYYGAAQPVRASLGMQPAPAAQVKLVAAPPSGNGPIPDAGVRDAIMSSAFGCNNTIDDRQWLNCYYASAQSMRVKLGLSAAPQAALPVMPVPLVSPSVPPASQFGRKPVVQDVDLDHVNARMTSYSFDKLGWFTVILDNGQVWHQVHGDTDFARGWKKPASTYEVRISHGFLNSYNLQVKGLPGLYKVLREDT